MPKDIFDLTDTSDLPENLRAKAQSAGVPSTLKRVEALLKDAGRPLSLSELRAAFYRRHRVEFSPAVIGNALRDLMRFSRAIRIDRGIYASPEHANITPIKKQA